MPLREDHGEASGFYFQFNHFCLLVPGPQNSSVQWSTSLFCLVPLSEKRDTSHGASLKQKNEKNTIYLKMRWMLFQNLTEDDGRKQVNLPWLLCTLLLHTHAHTQCGHRSRLFAQRQRLAPLLQRRRGGWMNENDWPCLPSEWRGSLRARSETRLPETKPEGGHQAPGPWATPLRREGSLQAGQGHSHTAAKVYQHCKEHVKGPYCHF